MKLGNSPLSSYSRPHSRLFHCLNGYQMGQEVQVRISDINTDNNTVNLSMVPAGAYDDRSGGGYGKDTK